MTKNYDREVAERLVSYFPRNRKGTRVAEQSEAQEDEFERDLLAKGVITHIPARDEPDDEFDEYEPIEVEGEPLSETIIRERR